MESAIYGLGEMGAHAASLRAKTGERLAGASAQQKVVIWEALEKIDGKKPVLGPMPEVK